MSTVKISQLPAITGANTASDDVIPIVDVSGNSTNKITREEFFKNIQGNVGIGTASPARPLDVNGTVRLADGAALEWGGTTTRISGSSSSNTIILTTNNTERLRIDASGNVGIGTSSPSTRLHVDGSVRITTGDGANFLLMERSANNGVYASWKRPNKEYILALDINNNGGTDFSLYDATAAATRLTVDGSGNLGLGVVPSAWSWGGRAIDGTNNMVISSGGNDLKLATNAFWNGTAWTYKTTSQANRYDQNAGIHAWFTAPSGTAGSAITFTQAMTLDAGGNLLVGTTSGGQKLVVVGDNSNAAALFRAQNNGIGFYTTNTSGTGTYPAATFLTNGGTTEVGSISVGATSTSYNTSSDYRLKQDAQPITDATSRLNALNPVNFAWKADGTRTDGFIAHEVQAVVPQAVTGEKDATDKDGNPVYQGIDQSKLVPLLTAALQEALAEIASLKARLDAANL